jgi:adenylylsulfate kinase
VTSTPRPKPRASVVWFTGLSGSGKSTLAKALCQALRARGREVEYLDGDQIRSVFPNSGFTREERHAHVGRVGFLASRLQAHGVTVVAALVSPYRDSRQFVRQMCSGGFLEVFVSTPIEVCEIRDAKGLYAKARRGEIKNFTGVDDPYEPPTSPELAIDTSRVSVEDAVAQILSRIDSLSS